MAQSRRSTLVGIQEVSFPHNTHLEYHVSISEAQPLKSDINQASLPTPFYSVLESISVFMALSTVFHSINSHDNSLFSHSVLVVLALPYWSFQSLFISLGKSPSALI